MSQVVSFLAAYDAIDRELVRHGFPATSPWWRREIERCFSAGRRRWIVRVGRRGGKSSTLARLAVAWALYGTWSVPPGDAAVVPFVSVSKDEAYARIRTIAAILNALGVQHEQRAEELEFKRRDGATVLFKVVACNTSAVVGFTSIAVFGDEVSRWESRDTGANPAREVIGSLAPTMATQPNAFMVLSSSPWSLDDFHAESFEQGETEHQTVSYAPTWIANPTISEAETHALEPNDRNWRREYLAEPSQAVSAAFDADDVVASCSPRELRGVERSTGWVALDPSSLRGDGFGFVIGTTTDEDEIVVKGAGEFNAGTPLRSIVKRLAYAARMVNTHTIYSDQREEAALRALFDEHGITLQTYAWSEPSKQEAVEILARWMHEQRLVVTADEADGGSQLRRELLAVKARMLPSGRMQYTTTGLDVASCMITLAHAARAEDFTFQQSIFDMYERIRKERDKTRGPGTTNPTHGALGFHGVDHEFLRRFSLGGW